VIGQLERGIAAQLGRVAECDREVVIRQTVVEKIEFAMGERAAAPDMTSLDATATEQVRLYSISMEQALSTLGCAQAYLNNARIALSHAYAGLNRANTGLESRPRSAAAAVQAAAPASASSNHSQRR